MKIEIKDENFFEEINSEIKAYLLGFFAADGNVCGKTNKLSLGISEKDEYIANLFKKYITPYHKIQRIHNTKGALNRQPQVVWTVSRKKLKDDLSKFGIIPNKTHSNFSLDNVPYEFKHHYIRGYFDGDGSIYRGFSKGRNKICVNFTNSTKRILEDINNYCKDINFKLETKMSKNNFEYYVLAIYNKIEVEKFYNIIYNNSTFYLKRKFDKFNFVNTVVS